MFEDEQSIVDVLLADDSTFRALHDRHSRLKKEVHDVEVGAVACDDAQLAVIKRKKLLAKDQMAALIAEYRTAHTSSSAAP